jgi:hypothetical protein
MSRPFGVVVSATGRLVACHARRMDAEDQIKAINANEHKDGK